MSQGGWEGQIGQKSVTYYLNGSLAAFTGITCEQ